MQMLKVMIREITMTPQHEMMMMMMYSGICLSDAGLVSKRDNRVKHRITVKLVSSH